MNGMTNMNAAQHMPLPQGTPARAQRTAPAEAGSEWSALMDGEVDADEVSDLLRAFARDDDLRDTCQRYALIGDALRAGATRDADTAPHVFVAGVRARLAAQDLHVPQSQPLEPVAHVRAQAANDAVFRWKLVAGFASLAAVMAVSWSVIGLDRSGLPQAGPQLVQSPAGGLLSVAAVAPVAKPGNPGVVVQTPHGPVLRDPRLEQLLAQHRQYGGMSALQMPAGFLRDATQQADPQR